MMDRMFLNFGYDLILDTVFRGDCSTKQVYEEGAKEIALSVVGGINCKYMLLWQLSYDRPLPTQPP